MYEKYLVAGLGVTGKSVCKYFDKNNICYQTTNGNLEVPAEIETIVLSPGIPKNNLIFKDKKIIGDIELFAQVADKPIYAITGTNGKTTVTTLVGEMAKASGLKVGIGGNIGTPALELLDHGYDCYVLELSSFQLETTYSLKADVACILNIEPDHMDRYDSFEDYAAAKQRIFSNARCKLSQEQYLQNNFDLKPSDLKLLGKHNFENVLAAMAIGTAAGFEQEAMLTTVKNFGGLEHRCERVAEINNVLWVNDSKGTNVAATQAAIWGLADSIDNQWTLILGGVGKGADFAPLAEPIAKHCSLVIVFGEDKQKIQQIIPKQIKCLSANSLDSVIKLAYNNTKAGGGVLFSPACASFDMFENYNARGKAFKQAVMEIRSSTTI